MINAIALLAFAIGEISTSSGNRFDLICEGSKIFPRTTKISQSWNAQYRFDLDKLSWCGSSCAVVYPISHVSEQEIDMGDRMVIDRTTGKLSSIALIPLIGIIKIEAVCTKREFSGFPEKKF